MNVPTGLSAWVNFGLQKMSFSYFQEMYPVVNDYHDLFECEMCAFKYRQFLYRLFVIACCFLFVILTTCKFCCNAKTIHFNPVWTINACITDQRSKHISMYHSKRITHFTMPASAVISHIFSFSVSKTNADYFFIHKCETVQLIKWCRIKFILI